MKHLLIGFAVVGSHTVAPQVPQHSSQGLDEVFEDN